MNKFSELGIEPATKGFTGDKIKMSKVLNKEITVHAFMVVPSNYKEKGDGKRLDMQISIAGTKYLLWTSSLGLRELIQKVPASKFPFIATIIEEESGRLLFT